MPTFERLPRFDQDWRTLGREEKERFRDAVRKFIHDLERGQFRKGLRVKGIQGTSDVYEMTFAPNGRATWSYGDEVAAGQPHVIWRRIGTHDVSSDLRQS